MTHVIEEALKTLEEPGTAQGYHMVSFGFILGELVRRVTGRTLGQYLRTEIAEPLGIDIHIGLPKAEHNRCAAMVNKPHTCDVLAHGGAAQLPNEHPPTPDGGLTSGARLEGVFRGRLACLRSCPRR